jgi:hypothetical protein
LTDNQETHQVDASEAQSVARSDAVADLGTRFLVYPQAPFVPGYERPELVWIPIAPQAISAGPSSDMAYVLYPAEPKAPYRAPYAPPFMDDYLPLAEAGPDGHFDHLVPGTPQFVSAHAFACVHRTLDICQSYVGRSWPWFFSDEYERLEVIANVPWNNAQSGFGFLELGEDDSQDPPFPYALNFDVIAHEVGHLALFSILGYPQVTRPTADYFAYHEAAADFISLLGLLSFDTALDRILRRTHGNLYIANELDRFAELTEEKQVRRFSNSLRTSDVGDDVHDRSMPFAGALFDCLIELYQILLAERGLTNLDPRAFDDLRQELSGRDLDNELRISQARYEPQHFAMKSALAEARDVVGTALARSWLVVGPEELDLREAKDAFVEAVRIVAGDELGERLDGNFVWRGFD